jgi:hypothetical protein
MPHRWGRAILWSLPLLALVLLLGTLAVTQSGDESEAPPPDQASSPPSSPTTSALPPEDRRPGLEVPPAGFGYGPDIAIDDATAALDDQLTGVLMRSDGVLHLVHTDGLDLLGTFPTTAPSPADRRASLSRPTGTLVYVRHRLGATTQAGGADADPGGLEVLAVDLDGGPSQVLGGGTYPSASPDGQLVAHLAGPCADRCGDPAEMNAVVVRDLNGTERARWTLDDVGHLDGVAWSEDGSTLYVSRAVPSPADHFGVHPELHALEVEDASGEITASSRVDLPDSGRVTPSTYSITEATAWHPIGAQGGVLLLAEDEPAYRSPPVQGVIEVDLAARTQAPVGATGLVGHLPGLRPGIGWNPTAGSNARPSNVWLPPADDDAARAWLALDWPRDIEPGSANLIALAL